MSDPDYYAAKYLETGRLRDELVQERGLQPLGLAGYPQRG